MESDSMKTTNREEIAEIVTHAAFYCGWPKAWAVFRMAKDTEHCEPDEDHCRPDTGRNSDSEL